MSELINKLILMAEKNDGIFMSGILTVNQKERVYLANFSKRNPSFFQKLDQDRTSIFRLQPQFYAYSGLESDPRRGKLSKVEVLQRCLWQSLLQQNLVQFEIPEGQFRLGKGNFAVDKFNPETLVKDQVQALRNNQTIITLPQNLHSWHKVGASTLVPKDCQKIWVKQHLAKIYRRNVNALGSAVSNLTPTVEQHTAAARVPSTMQEDHPWPVNVPISKRLRGAYWPLNESECHLERRSYPGLQDKLSGRLKSMMDNAYLEKSIQPPEDYFYGVYFTKKP